MEIALGLGDLASFARGPARILCVLDAVANRFRSRIRGCTRVLLPIVLFGLIAFYRGIADKSCNGGQVG